MGLFNVIKDHLEKVQQQNRENPKERTAPKEVFDRMRQKLEDMRDKDEVEVNESSMGGGGLFSKIKNKLEQVRNENREAPEEETAETSIFDKMRAELERLDAERQKQQQEMPTTSQQHKEPDYDFGNNPEPTNQNTGDVFGNASGNKEKGGFESPIYEESSEVFGDDYSSGNKERGDIPAPSNTPPPSYENVEKAARSIQIGGMASIDGMGGSLSLRMDPSMGSATNANRIPHGASIRVLEYNDQNKINLDGQVSGWYKVEFNGQVGWLLESYLK